MYMCAAEMAAKGCCARHLRCSQVSKPLCMHPWVHVAATVHVIHQTGGSACRLTAQRTRALACVHR
jgi:hypothetical protein